MAAPPGFYTGDMVRSLNSAERRHWPRYETVYGELLVSPAPQMWHQVVVQNLAFALHSYLQQTRVGRVFSSAADISWGLDDVTVQPDIFVAPENEARTLDWRRIRHLLLAVEVLSPSSARADRFTKRWLYQTQGTPLYWVIDTDAQAVEVWTPKDHNPQLAHQRLIWQPAGAAMPFTFPLEELFRPI